MSQFDRGKYYVSLSKIKPRFDLKHKWYRCECCSKITPYLLKKCCPSCGTTKIHYMDDNEIKSLEFWRKPIDDAISGKKFMLLIQRNILHRYLIRIKEMLFGVKLKSMN